MPAPITWLLLAAAVTAVMATLAGQYASRPLYVVTKPLPLLLLLIAVWLAADLPVKSWLLAALFCAWLGDIALLWRRGFLLGLLAFLLAHLAMMALLLQRGAVFSTAAVVLAMAAAALLTSVLRPSSLLLRIAVPLYALALALVVALALPFAWQHPAWSLLIPAALLFAFSDAALGWNKFRRPLPAAQLWILSSYFAAQCLFAYSFLTVM